MSIDGFFVYKGLVASQHKQVGIPFENLINAVKPKRILEIGTFHGGLTLLLRDILDKNGLGDCILRTYDINDAKYLTYHIEDGAKIEKVNKSLFNHSYLELSEKEEAKNFIQSEGTTIVLCDGGSKKNEFRLLSDLLKTGDIIMAHDYARNDEHFKNEILNNIWNWHEIQDSDIADAVNKNGLVQYMPEFENVAWICMIKK